MNKRGFLDGLDKKLGILSKEERETAIRYYEEYFDDAGEQNEQSVIAELESIEKVAELILKENGKQTEQIEQKEIKYIEKEAKAKAKDSKHSTNENKIGIIILVIAIFIFVLGGKFMMEMNERDLLDFSEEYSDNIQNLKIDIDVAELEIKTGNTFKVEATDIKKDKFEVAIKSGELSINNKNQRILGLGFNRYNTKIVLYIPKDFKFDNVNMKIGVGKIMTQEIISNECIIKVGVGEFIAKDLKTNYLDIDCGTGNAEIEGIVSTNAKINSGIGSISLDLKGNEKDYNYNVNVGIGEVVINENSYSGLANKKKESNTEKPNLFDISCGIGKVNLKIK